MELSGATISRVTAHHGGMVRDLGLGAGAKIQIIRSGEVIPKLEEVLEKAEEVLLPSECPSCGTELTWVGEFRQLPQRHRLSRPGRERSAPLVQDPGNRRQLGPEDDRARGGGGLCHAGATLRADRGRDPGDGFRKGADEEPARGARRSAGATWSRTRASWAAFGIKDLGVGDSRKLLAAFPLEALESLTAEQLEAVKGFGEVTSKSIVQGLKLRWPTIAHMLEFGFNLEVTPLAAEG